MTKYKVDKNIPIPEKTIFCNRKYPFNEMQIGDSFLVKNKSMPVVSAAKSGFVKKNPNYQFTMRKVKDGIRVWRIKAPNIKTKPVNQEL